jgi:branched-chain amino acid transport system permease protein
MLLQLIVSGILLGGIYALLSLGLSLIFGVSKFTNFAHGDFVMVGMYMAFGFYGLFTLTPYFSWPLVLLGGVAFGMLLFWVARSTIEKSGLNQILLTLGVSMVLQNTVLLFFKSDYKSIPATFGSSIKAGTVFISTEMLIAFIIAVFITAVFLCIIKYTDTGRALRAVSDDRAASKLMGLPVNKLDPIAFCFGITLACLAGALLMTVYPTTPTIGSGYNLIAWVTVVLGGLGFLEGALISAVLIGICETVSGFYLGADLRQAVYYSLFILVLVFRPQGLFAGLSMKRVKR